MIVPKFILAVQIVSLKGIVHLRIKYFSYLQYRVLLA